MYVTGDWKRVRDRCCLRLSPIDNIFSEQSANWYRSTFNNIYDLRQTRDIIQLLCIERKCFQMKTIHFL